MKKLLVFVGIVAVGLLAMVYLKQDKSDITGQILGSGNIPDRCEYFDQFASRSIKQTIKAAGGKVFSYRVVSTATNIRYFRLHDGASTPVDSSDVTYAVPLDTTTASATPKVIEERFVVPMKFNTGIGFSISDAFATWSSTSQAARNSYFVTVCYE